MLAIKPRSTRPAHPSRAEVPTWISALHSSRRAKKRAFTPLRRIAPQQPPDVVPSSAQHRVQRIARCARQPAPIHPVIQLRMSDHRLHCLAPLDPTQLLRRHRPALAPMQQLHVRHRHVDSAEPEINDDRPSSARPQCPGARPRSAAEFVRLARPALADAVHFRRLQSVQLVLAVALLRADSLGAFEQCHQLRHRGGALRLSTASPLPQRLQAALGVSHHHPQDRALPLDRLALSWSSRFGHRDRWICQAASAAVAINSCSAGDR
jgi:hypothetical protein